MAARDDGGAGSARRRRERRLRSFLRHERMAVAMALAESTHHSAQRQKTARAGEGESEMKYTAEDRRTTTPQEPGTQHFFLDDESVPELGGGRPDPVRDPGPPVVGVRHDGVGFEILLDVRVPQLGRDQVEEFGEAVFKAFEEEEKMRIRSKVLARIPLSSKERKAYDEFVDRNLRDAERVQAEHALEVAATGSQSSSNKMGRKRKKRKRRKKKLRKGSSSSFLMAFEMGWVTRVSCSSTLRTRTRSSQGTRVGGVLLLAWKRLASRRR